MSDNELTELWREARCVDGIKHAPCMGMVAIGDQMLADNVVLRRDLCIETEAVEALQKRVKVLEDALWETVDVLACWGGYASEYFRDKFNLQGDIARALAALEKK